MVGRVIALATILSFVAVAAAADAHPIGKVIDLLKKLKDQAIEEGKTEEVSFSKFQYWCSTSTSELSKATEEEKATIDELESSIAGLKQGKVSLEDEIKELEGEIKDLQVAAKEAKAKDKKRTEVYTQKSDNLKATIKAMSDAIAAMQGASKTDSMLLQSAQNLVRASFAALSARTTDVQRNTLMDFVNAVPQRPAQKVAGDQGKHVKKYNFKSDNVIDLLKELKLKFEDDLIAAVTEETNGANSYALEKQARDNTEVAAEKSKMQKTTNLAETTSALSDAQGNLKDEQADLSADAASLSETHKACNTKNREWEERSKIRSHEIEALTQGVKILAQVSGVRTEAPGNPVPPPSPIALLQVLDPKAQAVELLRQTAKTVHSKALERLALEVSTHMTGPFDKVNDMIQKMIFRLMSQQTDEDKHKSWCDIELEKTKQSTTDKDGKIKDLKAKIDEAGAQVAKLTNDITDADKMIADITGFMKEATEVRTAGKQENKVAIKDAKHAQTAIANAVAVLEDFYKSSGQVKKEAWEFFQKIGQPVKLPANPSTWGSSYTGVADPKNADTGVIAILETTAADFSKMEAETIAQEAEDQRLYDEQMKAHSVEKARRQQESNAKGQEKKRKIAKIESMTAQKKHTTSELDATKQYNKDLQPACVDGDSSYADRKSARSKEVQALKQAQTMLKSAFKPKALFLEVKRHA